MERAGGLRKGERSIQLQDEAIVERIVQGEQELYRLLVERHRNMLYGLIYGVLRHPRDAEDALQEALMRIYLSLPQFRGQSFKAWISRIAVNGAIDLRRSRARKQALVTVGSHAQTEGISGALAGGDYAAPTAGGRMDDWVHDGTGCSPPAETVVLHQERKERVEAMVEAMPEGYSSVVRAFYLEEKSQREIAEAEQIEVKSVESRLYRAKQWMRKHWKEDDLT
ncbi:RNA polymerase sigma factor (sigma-70 family) [Paenibacillus phyllosphaerae]|uniref:RNA polymerase sigma factor (Sigma-70 family) n=1 Tax=Paenibacillus phyllosphaerae TaxID=274593 RepID=A0A7W5AXQ1_9BACL|nr:sigma-70 family RNA polymerase sigma factor [Paenibacillus phyllosphaerae]MBB3110507.1 RNA polymerase sigma factor (sigma-70 family) [Paenibacillus phyllosphaerae]